MNHGDVITAQQLIDIVDAYGADTVSVDGGMPEKYSGAADLDLDGAESFRVIINYGSEVQFHLISDDMRAVVTTGMKGRCENMEWVA